MNYAISSSSLKPHNEMNSCASPACLGREALPLVCFLSLNHLFEICVHAVLTFLDHDGLLNRFPLFKTQLLCNKVLCTP